MLSADLRLNPLNGLAHLIHGVALDHPSRFLRPALRLTLPRGYLLEHLLHSDGSVVEPVGQSLLLLCCLLLQETRLDPGLVRRRGVRFHGTASW